jgi:hypothetical protein
MEKFAGKDLLDMKLDRISRLSLEEVFERLTLSA